MDLVGRKPVKDISVSGFGRVDVIGSGLARIWMFTNHLDEAGRIEHRVRKRPLLIPLEAIPGGILLMSKAVALSMTTSDRSLVATLTDGDGTERR